MGRGSETQPQVGENLNDLTYRGSASKESTPVFVKSPLHLNQLTGRNQ